LPDARTSGRNTARAHSSLAVSQYLDESESSMRIDARDPTLALLLTPIIHAMLWMSLVNLVTNTYVMRNTYSYASTRCTTQITKQHAINPDTAYAAVDHEHWILNTDRELWMWSCVLTPSIQYHTNWWCLTPCCARL